MFGKPDLYFPSRKLVVFADGEFWHGRSMSKLKLLKMKKFWQDKIKDNYDRDKRVNRYYKKLGFKVLRFWGKDLMKKPEWVEEVLRDNLLENRVDNCKN